MAYVVTAHIVTAYMVMAYVVMAYIVTVYIATAYVVMACNSYGTIWMTSEMAMRPPGFSTRHTSLSTCVSHNYVGP